MRKNEGEKESKRGVEIVDNVCRRKKRKKEKKKKKKRMAESEMEKGKII